VLAEIELTEPERVDANFVLSMLASLHGGGVELGRALDGEPLDWRRRTPPQLLVALRGLFADGAGLPAGPPLLPILDAELVAEADALPGFELLADGRLLEPGQASAIAAGFIEELGEKRWASRYRGSLAEVWAREWSSPAPQARDRIRRLGVGLLDSWEVRLQRALRETLDALSAGDPDGRLELAEDRLDRIAERARHLLRDHGSRSVSLHRDPDYEQVVHMITRQPDRFPGIRIESGTEREPVPDGRTGQFLAAELLGQVGTLDAAWVQRQRESAAELRALQQSPSRSDNESRKLSSLMQGLLLDGESLGVSGIEGYCDPELRGTNGYRERLGLEDVYGAGARSVLLSEVQDGGDVQLTLEPLLQAAAQATINHPRYPANDPRSDPEWFASPVGAIVLLTPDGRVLAAASAPDVNIELPEDVEGQRGNVIDRTLRAPTFQPVGSVFKPLVAVHALSRLDPGTFSDRFVYDCGSELRDGLPSCGGVRCHSRWGHGPLDLAGAIHVSCNTYFAALGDLLSIEDLDHVGTAFGFGQPTGIASLPGRSGLLEAYPEIMRLSPEMDSGRQKRLAANGLQIVQGTPMQVARAMAGLATGELPAVRLIDRVGGAAVPQPDAVPLPYPDWALATVRTAMFGVTNDSDGSAQELLSRRAIGYEIAAKTGSADLTGSTAESNVVRKHTWIAGWLPARDPQLVFCVFVHDTSATSTHSSVPVAEQLLRHDFVRIWLANRGVEANR
jgi:cell division protein FtsI/penicillin-binding protein 2